MFSSLTVIVFLFENRVYTKRKQSPNKNVVYFDYFQNYDKANLSHLFKFSQQYEVIISGNVHFKSAKFPSNRTMCYVLLYMTAKRCTKTWKKSKTAKPFKAVRFEHQNNSVSWDSKTKCLLRARLEPETFCLYLRYCTN